ncbi:MAG: hypothetical protein ABFD49_00050 [Armatimonadota bacterium]|nr:hypothetical protein [bacterium]
MYSKLCDSGFFDELYGTHCNDNDYDTRGTVGQSAESFFLLKLRKDNLCPVFDCHEKYTEEDLFDVIELLYDHVSKRYDAGMRHSWCECGGCGAKYEKVEGQTEFRREMNSLLADYGDGFELLVTGEIVRTANPGMNALLRGAIPKYDPKNVEKRVEAAIRKFRSGRSTFDDRRAAVRDLADVLEYLRADLKKVVVKKDEDTLFRIANEFGVRHHTPNQQVDYDPELWLGWMFYFYLSTYHVVIRTIKRQQDDGITVVGHSST